MNNSSSSSAAIDALKARYPEWQSTSDHVKLLKADPATKSFGEMLDRSEFAEMASEYAVSSRAAIKSQNAHKRHAKIAATFGFGAAVTAGLMLYLGATPSSGIDGVVLASTYCILILISLGASSYVTLGKLYRDWIDKRMNAERLRIRYFHDVLNAEPGAGAINNPEFTALKLEFVRAFLMDDQRDWFVRKAKAAAQEVKYNFQWRVAALTLIFLAVIPIGINILSEPNVAALLPERAISVISWFNGIGASVGLDAKILAFAGVTGGALQTCLTSLSATSLADRNALVYGRMVEALDKLGQEKLQAARAAASRGEVRPIEDFWRELSFTLIAEQDGWSDALQTAQLLTLDKLGPALTTED